MYLLSNMHKYIKFVIQIVKNMINGIECVWQEPKEVTNNDPI